MGDSRAVCSSGTFAQERKTERDAACPHSFGVQVFTRENTCQFEYFSNLQPALQKNVATARKRDSNV